MLSQLALLACVGLTGALLECPRRLHRRIGLTSHVDDDDFFVPILKGYKGNNAPHQKQQIQIQQIPYQQQQNNDVFDFFRAPSDNVIPFAFHQDSEEHNETETTAEASTTAATTSESSTLGSTTTGPSNIDARTVQEDEPEVSWVLRVPRSARTMRGAKVVNGSVSTLPEHSFVADIDALREARACAQDAHDVMIDFKDLFPSVKPGCFFVICINRSLVVDGQQHICSQCDLVQADSEYEMIHLAVEKDDVTLSGADIVYEVRDLPFPSAKVTTAVVPVSKDPRCKRVSLWSEQPEFTTTDPVFPNSITMVHIGGLEPTRKYRLETSLHIDIADASETLGINNKYANMWGRIDMPYSNPLDDTCDI